MKNLVLAAFVLVTGAAQANDGGMAFIDIAKIQPSGLSNEKPAKFTGGDAKKLFDLLPAVASVSREVARDHRSLALVSADWNVFLSCHRTKGKPVECSISAMKVEDPNYRYDLLGDAFKFEKDLVCKK